MVPDDGLDALRHDTTAITRPRCLTRIACGTPLASPLGRPRAAQTALTASAHQQTASQIRMLGVVTRGPLALALQLPWGQLPGLGINQSRHTDRPPLLLGPPHPRTTIARALLFQAPLPGGPLRLPRPRAVVGTIALLDRVAAACNHCTLRPAAAVVFARRDPLQGQAFVDGIGAELLLHTPAVHLAYHFCLSLMND